MSADDPVDELTYPVIEFSRGELVVIRDQHRLRRWTRAGLRNRWQDDLVIVDSSLRRWRVIQVRTHPDGLKGWMTGRLIAELALGRTQTVTLDDVRREVLDVLRRHASLWQADGQLDERLEAVQRAGDISQLVDALETDDP